MHGWELTTTNIHVFAVLPPARAESHVCRVPGNDTVCFVFLGRIAHTTKRGDVASSAGARMLLHLELGSGPSQLGTLDRDIPLRHTAVVLPA